MEGYLGVKREVFRGKKHQTKNNSKNGLLEVLLAFHSKDIENIALLNDSMYKSTPIHQVSYTVVDLYTRFHTQRWTYTQGFIHSGGPIHQVSYTAVDPSESFIAIKI